MITLFRNMSIDLNIIFQFSLLHILIVGFNKFPFFLLPLFPSLITLVKITVRPLSAFRRFLLILKEIGNIIFLCYCFLNEIYLECHSNIIKKIICFQCQDIITLREQLVFSLNTCKNDCLVRLMIRLQNVLQFEL